MKKIYVDDVPNETSVSAYLMRNSDWAEKMELVKPRQEYPEVLAFDIDEFDPVVLAADIYDAMQIHGRFFWNTASGPVKRYGGFSLVYNPNHIEDLDPHESTLGTKKNREGEFFHGNVENHSIIKNSYYDGHGFTFSTPASKHKSLGVFLSRAKRTMIRSRMAIIDARHHVDPYASNIGWRRAEKIFESMRVNIPIVTNENYLFQLEENAPVHLRVGNAYAWNTDRPYRVFSHEKQDNERMHLVLGFSPWWDFIPEENAWVQNEFYGKKHPYDMLADGDVFSGLNFREDIVIV